MKKLLILSIAILMVASCGKTGYSTVTRNSNSSEGTTTTSDPASAFNTLWVSEGIPELNSTNQEKRGLANFFGYNTVHYANILDSCYYGYTDETTTYAGPYAAGCFGYDDYLRNYFTPTSYLIQPFPAPKNLGSVSSYSIRFAANIYETSPEIIPGDAYLQVTIYTTSETLSREFTTMKAPMTVVSCGSDCAKITASFKDDCGSAIFHAKSNPNSSGVLSSAYITFKQDKSSYKKAKCYYDGHFPNGLVAMNNEMTDILPDLIHTGTDSGYGDLFIGGVDDLIEQ